MYHDIVLTQLTEVLVLKILQSLWVSEINTFTASEKIVQKISFDKQFRIGDFCQYYFYGVHLFCYANPF